MRTKDYIIGDRWVDSGNCKVWEKRKWGWKFLGIAKSTSLFDVIALKSTHWDHPEDIFDEESK